MEEERRRAVEYIDDCIENEREIIDLSTFRITEAARGDEWTKKIRSITFNFTLILPNELEVAGDWAFGGCTGLTVLKFGNLLKRIGYRAFSHCVRFTGELIFPDSFQEIGDWAFYNCAGLTDVTFPPFLNIAANAFK